MFCCLAVADFFPSFMTRFLVNLGQVPLFFYLTHIVLIHHMIRSGFATFSENSESQIANSQKAPIGR